MTAQPVDDPFAGAETHPSLSFKDKPIGTTYTGKVTKAPSLVQARDFESGEPAFWKDGNPKMTVVTTLILEDGEEYNLWAAKPSAMFRAIADAQKTAGSQVAVGGMLQVMFSGEKPNDNPRLNPQKLYTASYRPPNAFEEIRSAPRQWTPEQKAAAKAAGIPLPDFDPEPSF